MTITFLKASPRTLSRAGALVALAAAAAVGCSSSSSPPAAAPQHPAAVSPSVTPPDAAPSSPTLSAADIADNGLPSKVGAGKLSAATIKRLVQFFEDKVAHAYATGDADALDRYLAGPMLSGNRATISLLKSQDKLNVFRIRVESVKPQTDEARHVIVNMTGDMVLDYFTSTKTHKVLDHGLPGPSQVRFVVFLDQNPKTHTWYWTGEQDAANSGSTAGNNSNTTVLGTG